MPSIRPLVGRSHHDLDLMRIRTGARLRFEIDADDSLRQAMLLPLVLQALIENAVKHGLEPQVARLTLEDIDGGPKPTTIACLAVPWRVAAPATIVPPAHLAGTRRDDESRLLVRIAGRDAELPVSRAHEHLFKPM